MGAILALSARHHLARRRGVPRDRLDEELAAAAEDGTSRREFLAAAGVGLAGLAAPGIARSRPQPRLRSGAGAPTIAIVGAGISGLTAALQLRDAGLHA